MDVHSVRSLKQEFVPPLSLPEILLESLNTHISKARFGYRSFIGRDGGIKNAWYHILYTSPLANLFILCPVNPTQIISNVL